MASYFDTFVQIARIRMNRTLIVIVSMYRTMIHQIDLKTTFLNGSFEEKIYMDQFERFIAKKKKKKNQEYKMCKLVKSLYGV